MNLTQFNEELVSKIKEFGKVSMEHRQISRRLHDLLPVRLQELKYRFRSRLHSAAKAERAALTDPGYWKFLNEYIEMNYEARLARVQYETHIMLLQARQSLRAFNRR